MHDNIWLLVKMAEDRLKNNRYFEKEYSADKDLNIMALAQAVDYAYLRHSHIFEDEWAVPSFISNGYVSNHPIFWEEFAQLEKLLYSK